MADKKLLDLAKSRGAQGIAQWRAEHPVVALDLGGADLMGADLIGAELVEANLCRAFLRKTFLRGANLLRANLTGADLGEANLADSNLTGANLTGANLIGASMWGANLLGANLRGTHLFGADLAGTIFLDLAVDLEDARWNETTRWPDGFEPPREPAPAEPASAQNDEDHGEGEGREGGREGADGEGGDGERPDTIRLYPFGVLPTPISEAIAAAIEPLVSDWHRGLSDHYGQDTSRRVESCFSAIRTEARSGRADALTVFRQLQMLTDALGTDDSEEWAELFRAFTETRTPEAPQGASDAADTLDDALAKIPAGEPDKTLTRIGKEAFVESYGGGLGKWAAGLTAGVLAAGTLAGAHAVGGVDIAATAVGLGRWVLEVLKLSQAL